MLVFLEVDRKHSLRKAARLKSIVFRRAGNLRRQGKTGRQAGQENHTLTKAKVDKTALDSAVQWSKSEPSLRTLFANSRTCRELSAGCTRSMKVHQKKSGVRSTISIGLMNDDRSPETKSGPFFSIATSSTRFWGAFLWD